jgi:hypothetical protein
VTGHSSQIILPVPGTGGEFGASLDVFLHEFPHFRGRLGIGLELGLNEQAQRGIQGIATETSFQYQTAVIASSSDHIFPPIVHGTLSESACAWTKKSPFRGNGQASYHDVIIHHVIREH